MNIIIVGAGDVGSYLAMALSEQNHNITIIESDSSLIQTLDEQINAKFINDNGATARALRTANVEDADYVLAMTTNDAANLVCCSIAKALGAKSTIARIHHETYSDTDVFNYQLQFGADNLINPEALCAIILAKAIRNPGKMAVESLVRGKVEVVQIEASPLSKLIDLPLKNISFPKNLRIGYIHKNNILTIPKSDTIIQAGDLVTLFGTPDTIFDFKPQLNPNSESNSRDITLYGGTETAIMLAKMLSLSRFKIRFIEENQAICESLSQEFPNATIIQGDAKSLRLLEEEQIGKSDFFIACTKNDEDNIMTCLQVKRLGAKHIQLVVNKIDYEPVLNQISAALGAELAVSPREATVNELLKNISTEPIIELSSLTDGKTKIVKVSIPNDWPLSKRKIKDIIWPSPSVIVCLIHKYRATLPNAEDTVLAGDTLIIIIDESNIESLRNLLA